MSTDTPSSSENATSRSWLSRFLLTATVLAAGLGLSGVLLGSLALALAWPHLPALSAMLDCRPRVPLIEATLTKDQILDLYMNQIYLGHRAYGFAAASRTYFGKQLWEVTPAEAAMLAGIPKAPSRFNPIANFERARSRQLYVRGRMLSLGYLTQ